MLKDTAAVARALWRELSGGGTKLFVMANTAYNSCCVDEVGVSHIDAQCVVHYGHSCMSRTSNLPAFFVFGKEPLDVRACGRSLLECLRENSKRILGITKHFLRTSSLISVLQIENPNSDLFWGTGLMKIAQHQPDELNQIIVRELPSEHPLAETRPLRELLGHTLTQVCSKEPKGSEDKKSRCKLTILIPKIPFKIA